MMLLVDGCCECLCSSLCVGMSGGVFCTVECMRAFGAARNAAATCLPDFQSCVSKELCPKPAGGKHGCGALTFSLLSFFLRTTLAPPASPVSTTLLSVLLPDILCPPLPPPPHLLLCAVSGPGTPVAEAHTKCREAFCAQFYLRIAGISPHLHCCWSIATVLQSLGLDPSACAGCCRFEGGGTAVALG